MEREIDNVVMRLNPELLGDLHLPMFARVEAISDPIHTPGMSESFRPRYAVDVRVLDEKNEPDELFKVLRAVPLPASCAGLERGVFGFPEPGAIVELAFAYGLASKPFIRTILTDGLSVPHLVPNEVVIQAAPAVTQRADQHGNWSRITFANIHDASVQHTTETFQLNQHAHIHYLQVKQHSVEEVTGVKAIEALGALKLVSGGPAHLVAAHDLKIAIGHDQKNKVTHDLIQRIGNIYDSLATAKQLIKVKNGGKIWLGSEGENVLQILSELIQVVSEIANIAKDHTHKYTDNGAPKITEKPEQSGDFGGKKGETDGLKGRLDPIIEF